MRKKTAFLFGRQEPDSKLYQKVVKKSIQKLIKKNNNKKQLIYSLDKKRLFCALELISLPEDYEIALLELDKLRDATLPMPIFKQQSYSTIGDQFNATFCDHLSKICGKIGYEPKTKTFMLDYNDYCRFLAQGPKTIREMSYQLAIPEDEVMTKINGFFQENNMLISPSGIKGFAYRLGSYFQSGGTGIFLSRGLQAARVKGISGLEALSTQPYLFVAVLFTGSMFFYGCALLVGPETNVGKVCTTTGRVLGIPMHGMELMWNAYANPVVHKITGVPVLFNMTQSFQIGPGYTPKEIANYIGSNKKSIFKVVKETIISKLK